MSPATKGVKIEYAILCDDVRREDNGKLIIIGAYASDIRVSSYPAVLRLSAVLALRSAEGGDDLLKIRGLLAGKTIFESTDAVAISLPKGVTALSTVSGMPLTIEKDSTLDLQVRVGEGRYRSIRKIDILMIST